MTDELNEQSLATLTEKVAMLNDVQNQFLKRLDSAFSLFSKLTGELQKRIEAFDKIQDDLLVYQNALRQSMIDTDAQTGSVNYCWPPLGEERRARAS